MRPTGMTQDLVASPSISTVQAPHSPSPQPYLLPVRLKSLRSTLKRLAVESTFTVNFFPFTFRAVIFDIRRPRNGFGLVTLYYNCAAINKSSSSALLVCGH